jgi:hypothetical protein
MLNLPGPFPPPVIPPVHYFPDEDDVDFPSWKDASIGEKIYMVFMYGGLGILGIGTFILICLTIKVVIETFN